MKYAAVVVGALVALVVVVLVIGWMLPVQHRAVREATYRATPARLFALIGDVEAYPRWRNRVQRVEALPDEEGHRRFREIGRDGQITYRVEEMVPERRLVMRIADPSLPFGGRWTYDLASSDSTSTTLRITEDGEVYNPVFRFVSRFVMGQHATIDRYLLDVGKTLGESPMIQNPRQEE